MSGTRGCTHHYYLHSELSTLNSLILEKEAITTNISEALQYIHSVSWLGTIPGLEREQELLSRLGNPEKALKFVHIAGTNGKGSTAAMLAAILRRAGYRTGLYTSPYIVRFNERMQVDGVEISDEKLCALTEYVRPHADAMREHPSEFELITALGFEYFRRERCDIVVCEVGMGGDWDATNVIENTECAVITNIGLDHTKFLGDTVEAIARTKAGIVKPGRPCVLYHQKPSVEAVIAEICREKAAPLTVADFAALRPLSASLEGQRFDWGDLRGLSLPLLGAHQLDNAATALTAVGALRGRGWDIPETAVREGLAQVTWPGRFQVLGRDPLFIADGGHNPQCLAALEAALREYLPGRKLVFLCGCMADKDYGDMFRRLAPFASAFVTVTPDNPRALPAAELSAFIGRTLGLPATPCDSVAGGVEAAVQMAGPDGAVCACGSLYMLGDVMKALGL